MPTPVFDDDLRLGSISEPLKGKAFIAKLPVGRLIRSVLPGFSRSISAMSIFDIRSHFRRGLWRVKSAPGVGAVIVLMVLAEAADLRRFSHHRQFLKFCGLDWRKPIGCFQVARSSLQRGNARLRCALWMAAMSAARMRENAFRHKYRRYVAAS
jgi:hypothetical protein